MTAPRASVEYLPPTRREPPAELGAASWDELYRKLNVTAWTVPCKPTAAILQLAAERARQMDWLYG